MIGVYAIVNKNVVNASNLFDFILSNKYTCTTIVTNTNSKYKIFFHEEFYSKQIYDSQWRNAKLWALHKKKKKLSL